MSYLPYTEPANSKMPLKERKYIFDKYWLFAKEPDSHKMRSMYVELYARRTIKWGNKDPLTNGRLD